MIEVSFVLRCLQRGNLPFFTEGREEVWSFGRHCIERLIVVVLHDIMAFPTPPGFFNTMASLLHLRQQQFAVPPITPMGMSFLSIVLLFMFFS